MGGYNNSHPSPPNPLCTILYRGDGVPLLTSHPTIAHHGFVLANSYPPYKISGSAPALQSLIPIGYNIIVLLIL